jgi:hypothetical protein
MPELDTQKVWDALLADPVFTAGMPAVAHPFLKELVGAFPTVLKDHLEKPVQVKSLMETVIAVIEHEFETGFIGKLTAAMPAEQLPIPAKEMAAMVTDLLKELLPLVRGACEDPDAFLEAQGVDERTFLGHPKGGRLDASSIRAYDAGTLTIRGLLEAQPAIFIQFGQA